MRRSLKPWVRFVAVSSMIGLSLAGCGGDDDESATSTTADPSADAISQSGCQNPAEEQTEELFVRALHNCTGFQLYVFNDSKARDDWSKVATAVGAVELKRGERWIAVKP